MYQMGQMEDIGSRHCSSAGAEAGAEAVRTASRVGSSAENQTDMGRHDIDLDVAGIAAAAAMQQ